MSTSTRIKRVIPVALYTVFYPVSYTHLHPVTGVPLEFTSSLPADMAEFFPEYHA